MRLHKIGPKEKLSTGILTQTLKID